MQKCCEAKPSDTLDPNVPTFLLFDLDGTLSNPLLGIGRSLNHALEHFGHPARSMEELARFVGPPLDESFRLLLGNLSYAEVSALVAKYRERYGEIGYAENTLYGGIVPALRALSKAGVRMGVCTSKRADFAERILDLFELADYFEVVDGGDLGIRKGEQIRGLLERGVIDGSTMMVGDRAVDLAAARENGIAGVGVLWGFGSREELLAERPSRLLQDPSDLPSLAPLP